MYTTTRLHDYTIGGIMTNHLISYLRGWLCYFESICRRASTVSRHNDPSMVRGMTLYLIKLRQCSSRLGKGQGAKEIWHNLARERPKFWHNLVHERHKSGHSLEREWPSHAWTTKIRSQPSTRTKRGLGTILWAIDKNMGTNLQAVYSSSAVWKHKNSPLHLLKNNNNK